MSPTIGRIVHYRSRTGDYDVPAIINCSTATINPKGVEAGHVPALSSDDHVHLTVFTPGKPADYDLPEGASSRNVAGTYQEWDIPLNRGVDNDPNAVAAGTWRWPERA